MSEDTKNTKLWKLFEERDYREKNCSSHFGLKRNDEIDSKIDKLLRD